MSGKWKNAVPGSCGSRGGDLAEARVTLPPDGGWGWVVVGCAFLTNLVADGTSYTFGIFTKDIGHSLAAPVTSVALASSVMTGFYYLTGPFSCALINRYGFRAVACSGGLLAGVALGVSSTLTTLPAFVLVFGSLCGLGFSMLYVPSVMVVGFYFERWRPLATSLTVCGSSAGMVLFPPLFKILLDGVGWRVKFRLLCALSGLCTLLTLSYRPPRTVRVAAVSVAADTDDRKAAAPSGGGSSAEATSAGNVVTFFRRFRNLSYVSVGDAVDLAEREGNGEGEADPGCLAVPSRSSSASLGSAGSSRTGGGSRVQSRSLMEGERLSTLLEEEVEVEAGSDGEWRWWWWGCWSGPRCGCGRAAARRRKEDAVRTVSATVAARPMYRDDIFYTGSIYALSEQWGGKVASRQSRLGKKSAMIDYHVSVTRVTTQKDMDEDRRRCVWCPVAVRRTLATMLEVSLLRSLAFDLILLSGFFTTLGMYTPFIYIGQYAVAKRMSPRLAVYLISALGISNCVGRLACGVISSFPRVGALRFSCLSLILCGGVTMVSVLLYDVNAQFAYASLFGLTIAALPSLRSIILVEMFGLERLTNAFGLVMLFQGVACLAGLPISGALIDCTGGYDASFLFAGGAIAFSGLLLCPVGCLAARERRRAQRKREEAIATARAKRTQVV